MKINCLEVQGYGVWSGLKVQRLSDGLNVVYGPNEAGKTTLLQFVRSLLYGFTDERRHYLPPVHGGRAGGWAEVAGPDGRVQVDRHEPEDQPGREVVTITAADGTRQGEHTLKTLLANVDEPTFNNVFAVGLHEIQELGTLSDTQAAELLYNLTAGLDRISLAEVMRELETLRNRILDPAGGPCQVVQILAEREKLRQEIEELASLTRSYGRLADQRQQLAREITRLEEEKNRAADQARVIELAIGLRGHWSRRADLERALAGFGPLAAMPSDAVARLDALASRLADRQQRIERLDGERQELRKELADLVINEPLRRNAARIEALQEQEPWINTVQGQAAELEKEIAGLEAGLVAECERLGLGRPANADDLAKFSPRAVRRLRSPGKSLRACQERLDQAQKEAEAANRAAGTLSQQIDAGFTSRQDRDLGTAIDRAGNMVAQLRRRIQLDERLDQMARYHDELDEQNRGLLDRQVLPVWIVVGLGAVFVLGAALLLGGLAGLVVSSTLIGSFGWPLALLGIAGVGAGAFGKTVIERSNARQLETCHKQINMLDLQIKQAKEERDLLDEQLPRGGGPIASRLSAAEKELAALEELVPLDSRRSAAGQEAAAAQARAAQAEQELREARRRWRDAVTVAGLPPKCSPKQVRQLLRRSEQISQMQRRLAQRREELAQRRRELEMLVGRIGQLVADCGIQPATDKPLGQLRQLADALTQQQTHLARRGAISGQLRKIRRRRARHEEALGRLKRRRRDLLRQHGASDEQDFRRLAAEAARAETLRRDRDTLDREIAAAIGGQSSLETVRQQIEAAGPIPLENRREEMLARLAAIEKELHERLEKRGRLAHEMQTLADDRQLPLKQLALKVVEKRLDEATHRWQVLAVTCRVLEDIRRIYEHERQPETLQEASGYLERLTQGRYRRVWTPLGERTLRVDDAEGHSLPVEVLSRGAREQLFLSLRLALAAWYSRHGATLPLVLDDVLVNFDAARAKAAATVLRDFAATGHQLLVFTCHEHIFKLFKSLKVPAGILPDNSTGAGTIVFEDEPIEKPRRTRKPSAKKKPEPEEVEEELDEEVEEEPAVVDEEEPEEDDDFDEPEEDLWEEEEEDAFEDIGDDDADAA